MGWNNNAGDDMPNDDVLTESIRLIKAGKKAEAQLVLEPYIQANPHNIQAWMWEAEIFPADADKIKVLEICLEYNPGHPQVNHGLEILRARSGIQAQVKEELAPSSPAIISNIPDPTPAPIQATPIPAPAPTHSVERPARQAAPVEHKRPRKHPDWLSTAGVVDTSEIRQMRSSNITMYQAVIQAMYVVNGKDYQVKHAGARRSSIASMDAEILTSNYTPGSAVTVRYDPKHPWRAIVDDWEPAETKRKLRQFKDKPEVRQALSRRHRSRMLAGLGWAVGGIAGTVIGTIIFSKLGTGYYVVFGGAIVVGVITFISGLVGWLWYLD
jgi:hypothetical protein